MLSKNLVLRKRCYYYGDTKIKTDSKIYLSKTKMELMKKNFFKNIFKKKKKKKLSL